MIRNNSNNFSVDWGTPSKMDGVLHIIRYTHDAVYHPFSWVYLHALKNYYSFLIMTLTQVIGMCTLWLSLWRYDLGSRSWHTLGSWTIIMWNIIHIQHGSQEFWFGYRFLVCVHCGLDLGDMTLCQGHDAPFGHGQCCEISRWQWRVIAPTQILVMCALWPWPWRYDL